jgi:hypothetical protein
MTDGPRLAHIAPNVELQHVADESMLLETSSGTFFGLDAVGTRMLDLAVEVGDFDAAVDRLQEEYDAERAVLERDLERLLSELAAHRLIIRSDGARAGESPASTLGEGETPPLPTG